MRVLGITFFRVVGLFGLLRSEHIEHLSQSWNGAEKLTTRTVQPPLSYLEEKYTYLA